MLYKYALVEKLISAVQASSMKTGESHSLINHFQRRVLSGAPLAESASTLRLLRLHNS